MRFNFEQADSYGTSGEGNYFALKNDKDTARVRFMYNGIEDVEGYSVHKVEVGGKERYVNCIREYNEPKSCCPLCAAGNNPLAKFYIPLYNIDAGQVQIWERGKKFLNKLSSLCSRYPNLVSHTFEIERNGVPHDQATTYEIYETGKDDTKLSDLPEIPEILNGKVLSKNADEMSHYVRYGEFPEVGKQSARADEPVRRRTPADGGDIY